MKRGRQWQETAHADIDFPGPCAAFWCALLVLVLLAMFLLWRIDSPRVERFRAAFIDRFVPTFDWAMVPVTKVVGHGRGFPVLRAPLRTEPGTAARVAADEGVERGGACNWNSRTPSCWTHNQVRLDPKLTSVTGVVLADSGSPVPPVGAAERRRRAMASSMAGRRWTGSGWSGASPGWAARPRG